MPVTVGHIKSVTIADATDTNIVRPSDWNSVHAVTMNLSGTDLIGAFSNGGNVSFGTDGGGYITGSAPSGGGGAAISAGTVSQSTGTVIFSNSNGVSFGLNAGTLTASHNGYTGATTQFLTTAQPPGAYLTTARASNDAIGLNTAATNVTWTVNSAGISLDAGGYLTTAQPPGAYLTTARASNDGIGLNTAATNVTWTVNSAGLSLNAGGYAGTGTTFNGANLSGSMTVNSAGVALSMSAAVGGGGDGYNILAGGGTTAPLSATVGFRDTGGVSWSMITTGGSTEMRASVKTDYLTTARASNDAIGLNTAITAGPLAWTVNSGGISLNAGSAAGTSTGFAGANISGSMTHNTAGLNLSLSVNPGGAVTDSWSGSGNTFGTSSGTATQWAFQGSDAVSVAVNNGTIIIKAPNAGAGNVTFSAGANSAGLGSVVFSNSNGVSFGLNGSTITGSVNTVASYTLLTFQNRQLGASSSINSAGGQNSLWLAPARVVAPLSASTIMAAIISYSGTITSAATAQLGQTLRVGIWSQHTDPASTTQFGQYWTGNASMTFWNSGTSSVSYNFSLAGGNTTGSSSGSNLMTASVMGVRHIVLPIGSTMTPGLYVFGIVNSTSSAGYSAAMSRVALYMDNAASVGMGTFGQATNASIGYQDGGTYSATTGALPSTLALSEIRGANNVMPFFKVGAI